MLEILNQTTVSIKINAELVGKEDNTSKTILEKLHHIFRTTITPILTYTEMLLLDKFGSLNLEQIKRMQIIHENTKQLVDIINSMNSVLTSTKTRVNHSAI